MAYTLRPAIKSEAKPLIGLYSESGCGKTFSSLLLARGFAGPTGRIGMIETESGRGEAFVGVIPGGYDVIPMRETFAPKEYGEAISVCEKGDLAALIIDSASHEWESVGGVLHMAAENQRAGKKGPLVWQEPKLDHRRHFIQRLLSTPIPLVIVNMRARYPMKEDKAKKEWARSDQLAPMQAEDFLFEMFVHGWIDREHKFRGTKYTLDELRQVIVDGERISVETGQRLAAWARGGAIAGGGDTQRSSQAQPFQGLRGPGASGSEATPPAAPVDRAALVNDLMRLKREKKISEKQWAELKRECLGSPDAAFGTIEVSLLSDMKKRMEAM